MKLGLEMKYQPKKSHAVASGTAKSKRCGAQAMGLDSVAAVLTAAEEVQNEKIGGMETVVVYFVQNPMCFAVPFEAGVWLQAEMTVVSRSYLSLAQDAEQHKLSG